MPRRPLIVTADAVLLDDLRRLVAVAGSEPLVAADVAAARDSWSAAALVLVGDDVARRFEAAQPTPPVRRSGVVLVGRDLDDAGVWRRAVLVGAEHVVFLPDAEPWLVDRLGEALTDEGPRGRVIAVMGGRGGAGATSLAIALSLAARREGREVLLVDIDPLGGGIDLALGVEGADGGRWPDVDGWGVSSALDGVLPLFRGIAVLSCSRLDGPKLSAGAVREVLAASRRDHDLVVLDVPRSFDESSCAALALVDTLLLVVPAEVRACAAAAQVAAHACAVVRDVRVVVRGPAPSGLDADLVAEALGLPLAGWLRREPGIAAALERGDPPGGRRRGPLASFAQTFLAGLPWRDREGGGAAA